MKKQPEIEYVGVDSCSEHEHKYIKRCIKVSLTTWRIRTFLFITEPLTWLLTHGVSFELTTGQRLVHPYVDSIPCGPLEYESACSPVCVQLPGPQHE